ncbi:beta-1,3-glucanase family protein [Streptomyces sp. H27-H1]|uniref:beta-1,3-glucanase family protein n=1 Tax=Streptomyces sp. H27-H1 TaxID=2996461 RepID=UPI00226FA555|nr:beta-1,3-glucanase family protein [Streptomyces sp. H27-H1]MCY0932129.1 beta-1,3-glucanase family protein [Streptomyces sp. H27-H1]
MSIRSTARPHSTRLSRASLRTVTCAALLLAVPTVSIGGAVLAHADTPSVAASTADSQPFDQTVTTDGSNVTWSFSLKDHTPLDYVGLNFTPKGAGQQSFTMTPDVAGKTWTFTQPATATTPDFSYFLVYKKQGAAVNEPQTPVYDQTGQPVTPVNPPNSQGTFPLHLVDANQGDYATIVGQPTPGHYAYVTADGTVKPVTEQPKEGMSFALKPTSGDTTTVELPKELQGGRIFISKKPLTMPAATVGGQPSDSGYIQPDLNNPSDPNQGNPYDFAEYTFKDGAIPFGGNTSQVDGFSIPMTLELKQDSSGFDKTVGIKDKSTAQVIADYKAFVQGDGTFGSLVNAAGTHITAPRSAQAFVKQGADYFDGAIKTAWGQWAKGTSVDDSKESFVLPDGDNIKYEGDTGAGGTGPLSYTKYQKAGDGQWNKVVTGQVDKPSTGDVTACAGNLAKGSDADKFVEAHLCAAFNRGVSQNAPSAWGQADTYYKDGTTFNKYAAFFHKESVNGLAYGFAYDDVHDKSSVMILPKSDAPTSLTLTVGSGTGTTAEAQ